MKKILAGLLLVCVSQLALALPTPNEIATSVKSGRLTEAESMLQEVIKAKPQSAKAFYELGQVFAMENHRSAAIQALHEAEQLDASLKFTHNPQHFQELLGKLESGHAAPAARSMLSAASASPAQAGFSWLYILIGGGVLFAVWLSMRRSAATAGPNAMTPYAANPAAGGYGATPSPYTPAGSGIGGAVLGGVAGMAAGYGLAKLMEHEGQSGQVPGVSPAAADSGIAQPDYGDFDAGTGDSWDAGDSSGGGDDSW